MLNLAAEAADRARIGILLRPRFWLSPLEKSAYVTNVIFSILQLWVLLHWTINEFWHLGPCSADQIMTKYLKKEFSNISHTGNYQKRLSKLFIAFKSYGPPKNPYIHCTKWRVPLGLEWKTFLMIPFLEIFFCTKSWRAHLAELETANMFEISWLGE
jgi:hypothetical protein